LGIKGSTPAVEAGNNQSINQSINQLINGAMEQSSNRAINQAIKQSIKQSSNQLIAQESSQSIINLLTIKCGVAKGRKAKPSCLSINNHIHRSQALEFTATNDTNQCTMPTRLLTCLTAFLLCRMLPHPPQQAHC
jgi:hypothetical protein